MGMKITRILGGGTLPPELLSALGGDDERDEGNPKLRVDVQVELLREHLANFSRERVPLKVGDIVRQVKGLARYKIPADDEVAIVVKVLDQPVERVLRSLEYETLDFVIGVRMADGCLCTFYADSRCFEPVPAEDLAA